MITTRLYSTSNDVPFREGCFTCRIVKQGKMLLADGIHASFQLLDVVAVGYFRWVTTAGACEMYRKKANTGSAMLQDLERYVGAGANAD
jgi:hypothetical protein